MNDIYQTIINHINEINENKQDKIQMNEFFKEKRTNEL